MPPSAKRKAEKLARKQVVVIQRNVQGAREGIYRIRAILELGLDPDAVEAAVVAQMEAAHAALAKAESGLEECLTLVGAVPVMEDYE